MSLGRRRIRGEVRRVGRRFFRGLRRVSKAGGGGFGHGEYYSPGNGLFKHAANLK